MENMSDLLRHDHDTAFHEGMDEAREKERPKRSGKKAQKAKNLGRVPRGDESLGRGS